MPEQRPDPEQLLQRVQEEERKDQRGKLKIYLGAAPGVGKTHTMLEDAMTKRSSGLDVVIGVVESHGRKEIDNMLNDFEFIPKQIVNYRDRELTEFDLDTALKRQPALILMDEMAHTNAPGVRHAKRWQDIKELLDRGIDVYTTLNVQHIESLNDTVSRIIHAPVKETVPDSMVELADTIELIDLPPEDLLKRLQEGKIYVPQQAALAVDRFFRKGNLIALRELALRITAERVGAQVLLYRHGQGIKHIWPTKDKILVCVGSRPESVKLLRAAKRLANSLQAEWVAVYVDTPGFRSSEEDRNRAIQNLRLAEMLGAETRVLNGFDIVNELLKYAREQNVTLIMMWKHIRTRWRDLIFRNLADELVRHSGEIDVYIMTGNAEEQHSEKPTNRNPKPPLIKRWYIYGVAIGVVSLASIINYFIFPFSHTNILIMVYILAVMIIALFGEVGPSIFASILGVFAYDFFFIPPYFTIGTKNSEYLLTLVTMLVVTQIISQLIVRTRRHAEAARSTENQTLALYTLSRQLASTRGINNVLETGSKYISDVFHCEVSVLLPESGRLVIYATGQKIHYLDPKEQSVAQWVYDLGQNAGLGTETLSFSPALYIPLSTSQGAVGVLRIIPNTSHLFTPEQMHLLEACANQLALAIEVDRMQEKERQQELEMETDLARKTLLHSLSHDLATPLISVIGAANTLAQTEQPVSANKVSQLGKYISSEAEQLSRLLNNLLQITYIESKALKLEKEVSSIEDVIKLVLITSSKKLKSHPIQLKIPETLPKVALDNTLIQEVLHNLIDNAVKFTPANTEITISAKDEPGEIIVSVEDNGPGLIPDEVDRLFQKFYRGRMLTTERGLGLGLAICRNIIEAHGGKIWAENRPQGGAAFRFSLPKFTLS